MFLRQKVPWASQPQIPVEIEPWVTAAWILGGRSLQFLGAARTSQPTTFYEGAAPLFASGPYGAAHENDATTHHMVLGPSSLPTIGTSNGWIMAVFRADGYVNNGSSINVLVGRGSLATGVASGPALILSNTHKIAAHVGGNSLTAPGAVSATAVNDGRWHCAVAFRTGTTVRLALDGVLQAGTDSAASAGDSTQPTRLFIDGAATPGTARYFDGACSQVAYGVGLLTEQLATNLSADPFLIFKP